MADTITFLIEGIPENDWNKFKNSIPRTTPLNEALIDLIQAERIDAKTDSKGRVNLGVDHAEQEVTVAVIDTEE